MGTVNTEIRILIADDHPIVRRGLRQVIEAEACLKVVGEADDGEAALVQIQELRPEVAVLDVNMPKLGGFDLLREIQKRGLPVATIFLTMYSDEELFNEALDLGAKGYVLKESAVTDIVNCVKAVAAGRPYITPSLSEYLLNRSRRATSLTEQKPSLRDLTPAERRILKLIAANKSSKEIAEELYVSVRTVENHRTNICQKLDIHGNNALLRFALEHRSELS
ncbi:MAG TPA: response regulator transcription factor [Blastocatellia bacterium]|nr:response regulator transcription factor [Blastocatellia bacterium]